MEFEAETWWFWSTHEYYKTTKFQLQTPSLSAPTRNIFPVISGMAAPIKEINGYMQSRSSCNFVRFTPV